jgi:hypothetical protein
MSDVKCFVCGKSFYAKPFFIKNGGGKYCSKECHHLGLKKGKVVKCDECGKDIYKSPQALKRSQSKKFFCNKSCQTKWRNAEFVGPKHANWKHGEQAYRSVLNRHGVKKQCCICKTLDERVLATHHLDKNRKNNEVKNLCYLCHNCHFLVHYHKEKIP